MVELKSGQFLIDGRPKMIFCGEVHYFRLKRSQWEDRILKLKDTGCNCLASYIPWLLHEPEQGQFDLNGRLHPENDLAAYIDLVHKHGLMFFARPGPFIMAEMKNEGIPYWVREKHPEVVPQSFDGQPANTKTLDYLAPAFLEAAKNWYGQVMPILAARQQSKGGPVIAVQLDNEVGMLSWVSNQPDLSEDTICDFAKYLLTKYDHETLSRRYPFDMNDPAPRLKELRSPREPYAAAFLRDYGDFERNRFARYFSALRGFAEESGVKDVAYVVNIHGTGSGRLYGYPLGIQQLFESFNQGPGYMAGSDHYLGEMSRYNGSDIYLMNAQTACMNKHGQPLSSVEFEVGSGDYGDSLTERQSTESADIKIRMCVAQGNRLLNFYSFCGGHNRLLDRNVLDGNGRISTTGARHGFAAPISPEGKLDPTYFGIQRTTKALSTVAPKLAQMREEHDDMQLVFIPDYYKTQFKRPGPMQEITRRLDDVRGSLDTLSRMMLFAGFRYPCLDLQHDVPTAHCVAFASARYLDAQLQEKLVAHLRGGGTILMHGDFPTMDMEGQPCRILADALGIEPAGFKESGDSVQYSIDSEGWAAFEEGSMDWTIPFFKEPKGGVFMRLAQSHEPVGFDAQCGAGKTTFIPGGFPGHLRLFRTALERLGVRPTITTDNELGGLIITTGATGKGERFLTAVNIDPMERMVHISEHGKPLFGGQPLYLGFKGSKTLPLGVQVGHAKVVYSTMDIREISEKSVSFGPVHPEDRLLVTAPHVRCSEATVTKTAEGWLVKPHGAAKILRVVFG